jgi:hypothetical protein
VAAARAKEKEKEKENEVLAKRKTLMSSVSMRFGGTSSKGGSCVAFRVGCVSCSELTVRVLALTVAAFPVGKRDSTVGRAEASRKGSSDSVGNGKVAPFDEEATPPPTVTPTKTTAAVAAESKHSVLGGSGEGTYATAGAAPLELGAPPAAAALSVSGKLVSVDSLSDVSSCDLDAAEESEGVSELVTFSPRTAVGGGGASPSDTRYTD